MSERRRRMERVGDILPAAARDLGLADELRLAQAIGAWERVVASILPAAVGGSRLVRAEASFILVEADAPIVAQELRIRLPELLEAFRAAPGGYPAGEVRIAVRHV